MIYAPPVVNGRHIVVAQPTHGGRHLVLPATVTALVPAAIIARLARASLIEVMHQDYIRVCLAKGLPYWKVYDGCRSGRPPFDLLMEATYRRRRLHGADVALSISTPPDRLTG